MKLKNVILIMLTGLMFVCNIASAKGVLSKNWRIESKSLGYALQYRVYLPEGIANTDLLPTIYITDGQSYISQDEGRMIEVLDREIEAGNIKPVVAVFIDSRNPDDLTENRRNEQFICNQDYAAFFITELVPTIDYNFPVSSNRNDRVIAGVSFGGLNAACFGLLASKTFSGIGMHSPANDKHLKIISKLYKSVEAKPLKIFMSVGTKRDNTRAGRRFYRTLKEKNYDINYIEVPFGHVWENWRPLMDDLLYTFFKKKG